MKNKKKYEPDRVSVNTNSSKKNATAMVNSVINTLTQLPLADSSNILADFEFDEKGKIHRLHLEIDQD